MPEQKLTWEQMPEGIRKFVKNNWPFTDQENREIFANDIMEAMKPELEKAWNARTETRYKDDGDSYESIVISDFETWYQNTYLK